MTISSSLTDAYNQTQKKIELDKNTKIILFSDLHRGVGDWSDDFAYNLQVFKYALQYYLDNDFTYIEVGDGDELWENNKSDDIKNEYYDTFDLMSKFYHKNKLHIIWGNHNEDWKNPDRVKKELHTFFPGLIKYEDGVKLGDKIFIVHGHQVDFWCNNRVGKFSRYIVRNIWKPLQNNFGWKDPTSPAKNFNKRDKVDDKIFNWGKERKMIVIAGHTHRPMFKHMSKNDRKLKVKEEGPYYFNTGSCVHPRCITGIEIDGGYLFSWYEIPGSDSQKLKDFLRQGFGIDWVKTATIEKIDNDKTLRISNERKELLLKLNNEKTELTFKTDDGKTHQFNANIENNKLKIYDVEKIRLIKWFNNVDATDGHLFIDRKVLEEGDLQQIINEL